MMRDSGKPEKKGNAGMYLRRVQEPPESFEQAIAASLLCPKLVPLGDSPLR